jgi:dolichol kinase
MRKHECHSISGMTYLYLGTAIILFLFDKKIVTLTLLFLAFGDPIASYFGIKYGRDKIFSNKSLQGTMAAFATCTVIAMIFYYWNNLMTERLLIVAPLSGMIGAVAEATPVGKLDDNLTFPVISATCLWVLFHLFGGF